MKHTIPFGSAVAFLFLVLPCLFSCEKVDNRTNPVIPPQKDTTEVTDTSLAALSGNVKGYVRAAGKGIGGVAVSDGFDVTLTDSLGRYAFTSYKTNGYVFISVPSGYEVPSKGVLGQFYAYFTAPMGSAEIHNFNLTPVDQSDCRLFFLGDMHLAGRMNDLQQFETFADDLARALSEDNRPKYVFTLGDMSWDAYWNRFALGDYLSLVNRDFPGAKFFHTIGNHDHELAAGLSGDVQTVQTYRSILGPNYFSVNIGGVHCVVMDNIICRNEGTSRRSSNQFTDEQLQWLEKDLAAAPKGCRTAVLTVHCPLYSSSGASYTGNAWNCLKKFGAFDRTIVASGHTHTVYNLDKLSMSVPDYEMTCGAVCGAWWTTGYDFKGLHMCSDGAPGGYRVMDLKNGEPVSWHYKPSGLPRQNQFRTYDRNCINLNASTWAPGGYNGKKGPVSGGKAENVAAYNRIASDYTSASSANQVLINVWDWDEGWDISVKEGGRELKVTQVKNQRDPLYVASYEAYSYLNGYVSDYGSGLVSYYSSSAAGHLFSVTASSASSTLDIEVKDRFGNVFSEKMYRPKKFSIEGYIE